MQYDLEDPEPGFSCGRADRVLTSALMAHGRPALRASPIPTARASSSSPVPRSRSSSRVSDEMCMGFVCLVPIQYVSRRLVRVERDEATKDSKGRVRTAVRAQMVLQCDGVRTIDDALAGRSSRLGRPS